MEKFDIIIIGAGAAGLMAAKVLSEHKKNVCVLEARDRIGGRVHTLKKEGFTRPVEAGAEFIHGRLPLTIHLLEEAGIQYHETEGELWELKNDELVIRTDFIEHADQLEKKFDEVEDDMSVADLLKRYFADEKYADMKHSLKQYIEGYDAADIELYSSLSLKEEWQNEEHEQFRIEGGYGSLFDHLKKKCDENGCLFRFSTVVKQIKWKEGNADVITAGGKIFSANKIIITIPPIFLAEESEASVSFDPQLPIVTAAARQIGYGGVIKAVLEFDHPFWETGECRQANDLYFLFSEEKIPTWWSQLPDSTPMLTGWLAGPKATDLAGADDETILYHALISLSSIFDIEMDILQQYVRGSHVHNWVADPFSRGAYSYNTTTSVAAKKILRTPVGGTLFIAGEAVSGRADATVEAALGSGREVAENILKTL